MSQPNPIPRCLECGQYLIKDARFGLICRAHPPIAKCGNCLILIGPTYLNKVPVYTLDGVRCEGCANE